MDKKISELPIATTLTGPELIELVQGGVNKQGSPEMIRTFIGEGITREFGRTYTSTLLFDKNMIEGELYTQTDDITFEVAETGNLVDQESVYGQRIVLDGEHPVYFSGFNHVANIASGDILEAGTYQFIFWYSNGIVRGSIMLPRQETVMLLPLGIPANFAAVPGTDPETELDLSWDAVANVSSYEIYRSTAGGAGPWTSISTPAAGDTTYTDTGRSAATTYHYRIRAIGDQVSFSNSGYAITAATTTDGGDVTAPVIESSITDSATDIDVNQVVVFTSDEPLIDSDGVTEITNTNILDYLTAVNSTAGAQTITATIDATKTIITITPNSAWDPEEDITISLDGVADQNGNVLASPFEVTFTTWAYTLANSNYVQFTGAANTAITNVICIDNANFDIQWTSRDLNITLGASLLVHKYTSDARSLLINSVFPDLSFKFYSAGGSEPLSKSREIVWTDNPLATTEQTIRIEYRGAIDTNDGLDRLSLYVDDVLQGSKTLIVPEPGVGWPFYIRPNTAPFRFGPARGRVKDLMIKSNNGTVTELHIPTMRTGIDISGNNRHGSWT